MKLYFCLILLSSITFSNYIFKNNCILDFKFETWNEPGPDLIIFNIKSNEKSFGKNFENFEVVEVYFNEKESFKSNLFLIKKIKNNTYELKISSPYFSIDYIKKEEVYKLFDKSDKLQIKLKRNNDVLTFTKCFETPKKK